MPRPTPEKRRELIAAGEAAQRRRAARSKARIEAGGLPLEKRQPVPFTEAVGEFFRAVRTEPHNIVQHSLRFHSRDDTYRALQHETTGDTTGLLPSPEVDDLVKFAVNPSRPEVMASRGFTGPKLSPNAKTFQFGRVTQRAQVGAQAAEGDLLASRKMTVVADVIANGMFGGTAATSEQVIDWTDGADGGGIYEDILEDLAALYGEQTEAVTTAAVEAAATNTTVCSLTAASTVFAEALAAAAASVLSTAKVAPDAILVAPDRWEYVLGLTDNNGAVVYVDGRPLTLPLVMSSAHSAGFIAVAATKFVKTWERVKGATALVREVNDSATPSTLEYIIGYRGYFAAKAYAQGLCALVAS
jgi:hypothetical protein